MRNNRFIRMTRAAVVGGLLSVAGMAVLVQPVHAQASDPSDPSDPAAATTTTAAFGDTATTLAGSPGGNVSGSGLALTGGSSEVLLLGGLGLGAAAVAARRYARRA